MAPETMADADISMRDASDRDAPDDEGEREDAEETTQNSSTKDSNNNTTNLSSASKSSSKSQRQRAGQDPRGYEISTTTIRAPPFAYACLELQWEPSSRPSLSGGGDGDGGPSTQQRPALDELLAHSYITAALTRFLGLAGAAIAVDILKIQDDRLCWVRVPRQDLSPFLAAVGGVIGGGRDIDGLVSWIVRGSGNWLSPLITSREIQELWQT